MKFLMKSKGLRRQAGLKFAGALLAALWLAACSQVAPVSPVAEKVVPATSPAYIAADHGRLGKAKAAEEKPRLKAAEERPGLATGQGEQIESPWNRQSFVRASASKPAGTGAIYYNNREGIEAMTGYKEKVDGVQRAAGDMIEWGVKGGFGYLPSYQTYGPGRRFVVGSRDSAYSIVLKNRCKSRLEVVLSVDGLDVIDGKSAGFSKRGYVIASGETLEVKGWRTSPETVARFKFSTVAGSYANLAHGDHRNVGVIGLAVFTEQGVDPWTWMPREVDQRLDADPFARKL
jgi:hypothetical protein